jgi:predicted HNH restriction endonuclease
MEKMNTEALKKMEGIQLALKLEEIKESLKKNSNLKEIECIAFFNQLDELLFLCNERFFGPKYNIDFEKPILSEGMLGYLKDRDNETQKEFEHANLIANFNYNIEKLETQKELRQLKEERIEIRQWYEENAVTQWSFGKKLKFLFSKP